MPGREPEKTARFQRVKVVDHAKDGSRRSK
jgi:hypothetical protein